MSDVIVIGVAGGTGSGKTTLVKALVNRFGDNISVLSHDNYYKRHDEMSYEERTHLNYDCPDAFAYRMLPHFLFQNPSCTATISVSISRTGPSSRMAFCPAAMTLSAPMEKVGFLSSAPVSSRRRASLMP